MLISVEVPVFKGRFLRSCIESVLNQTSEAWTLSLVWDGGDEASRKILEQLQEQAHPRVRVFFTDNHGIACARRFLTERGAAPYILPLDDDDRLAPRAIERFLQAAESLPWASLIRARRAFIDEEGALLQQTPWFPFGPRNYQDGMVTDLFNQAQPYLIRRSAYDRTGGWRGFSDFMGAGEDCDIFLQLEDVAHFELIDEVLYHYRLHECRASHALTPPAAFEMWRRLADRAIGNLGLPLARVNEAPPFVYARRPRPAAPLEDVQFVLAPEAGRAAAALRRCGVTQDAIFEAAALPRAAWKMAGFRATQRPLLCYLNERVAIQSRAALEALVRVLNEADCDLVAARLHDAADQADATWPRAECLLLRRAVLAATGGFDERCIPLSLQELDLWLQARRRGFRCLELAIEGLVQRGAPAAPWTDEDVRQLRSKWRTHPSLLPPETR